MADHNTRQAVAERIKEWIGTYGGENTATLLLYEAMNALNGAPAAAVAEIPEPLRPDQYQHAMSLYSSFPHQRDSGDHIIRHVAITGYTNGFQAGMHCATQQSGNPGQVADAQPVGHVCRDASVAHMSVNLPEGTPLYAAQVSPQAQPCGNAGELTPLERQALAGLIELASIAFHAADDSEEDDDPDRIHVDKASMNALGDALDKLDQLPDDCPGYTMGPSGKAEWALRRFFGGTSIAGHDAAIAASKEGVKS